MAALLSSIAKSIGGTESAKKKYTKSTTMADRLAAKAAASTVKSAGSSLGSGSTGSSGSVYTGSNFHQDAIDAAARGDWDTVTNALTQRDQKVQSQGGNDYGTSSYQIYQDLVAQYGGPSQASVTTPQYEDFSSYLADMGYSDYSAQTQAAIQAAVDAAIQGYQSQMDTTNQDSDELARQAYINSQLGQKNLGQQLSANGYAGGMADSQRIAVESDYQNQLTQIEQQRLATIRELENAITNAQLTGDMQTAQELASYLQQVQGQWASYVQNQQSLAAQNQLTAQQMAAQNTDSAYTRALNLINSGFLPDDDTLAAAGISKLEAQSRLSQIQAQLGGVTGTPAATPAATPTNPGGGYDNGSLTTAQVRQLQQILGVTADGLWGAGSSSAAGGMSADEAWAAFNAADGGGDSFQRLYDRLNIVLSEETPDNAQAVVDSLLTDQTWNALTSAQRAQITALLNNYGSVG